MVFDFKENVGNQLNVPTFRENTAKEKASSDAKALLTISNVTMTLLMILIVGVILVVITKGVKF